MNPSLAASKTVASAPDRLRTGQEAAQSSTADYPDLHRLTRALRSVLRGEESNGHQIRVLDRKPNIFRSSFHSEIVICQLADGSRRLIFCKHAVGSAENNPVLKGGVPYEASVYREVLRPLPLSHAHFYGGYTDAKTGEAWLFLEFLDRTSRLSGTSHAGAMELAARWLGSFHASNEARVSDDPLSFLGSYGFEYYLGWADRTWSYAGHLRRRTPWLARLCKGFREVASLLLRPPLTVIHGECTPRNVLIRRKKVYPIDWESAAIAAGEIDVAALTWGWPKVTVRRCELEYRRARWPQGAPAEFKQRINCARLFWLFRWLGDPDPDERTPPLFRQLQETGRELGMIR